MPGLTLPPGTAELSLKHLIYCKTTPSESTGDILPDGTFSTSLYAFLFSCFFLLSDIGILAYKWNLSTDPQTHLLRYSRPKPPIIRSVDPEARIRLGFKAVLQ